MGFEGQSAWCEAACSSVLTTLWHGLQSFCQMLVINMPVATRAVVPFGTNEASVAALMQLAASVHSPSQTCCGSLYGIAMLRILCFSHTSAWVTAARFAHSAAVLSATWREPKAGASSAGAASTKRLLMVGGLLTLNTLKAGMG